MHENVIARSEATRQSPASSLEDGDCRVAMLLAMTDSGRPRTYFPVGNAELLHLKHKSHAKILDYHPERIGLPTNPSKPDIPPDDRWRIPMKTMILAAFAALSLSAGLAPLAQAATFNGVQTSVHQGPYDNTTNSLGGRYVGGGD
jgi:hypothetical protein